MILKFFWNKTTDKKPPAPKKWVCDDDDSPSASAIVGVGSVGLHEITQALDIKKIDSKAFHVAVLTKSELKAQKKESKKIG
jgi:hypothetical protein